LIALFVRIDNICKKKMTAESLSRGRPNKLFPGEIIPVYAGFMRSKTLNFKAFYGGIHGIFLRPLVPKMPPYTDFLKQLKKQSKNLLSLAARDVAQFHWLTDFKLKAYN
jgi:hypothetical protein